MVCDHNDGLDADYIGILSVYPDFEVYRCECGALINIGDASARHEVVEENTEPEAEEINPETTKEAEAPDATPNAWKKWGEWFKLAKESGLTLTALQDDTDLWTLEAATEAVRKAVSGIQQGKDLETAQTWLNEQLSAKA